LLKFEISAHFAASTTGTLKKSKYHFFVKTVVAGVLNGGCNKSKECVSVVVVDGGSLGACLGECPSIEIESCKLVERVNSIE
jgi:hypothetical protein